MFLLVYISLGYPSTGRKSCRQACVGMENIAWSREKERCLRHGGQFNIKS